MFSRQYLQSVPCSVPPQINHRTQYGLGQLASWFLYAGTPDRGSRLILGPILVYRRPTNVGATLEHSNVWLIRYINHLHYIRLLMHPLGYSVGILDQGV